MQPLVCTSSPIGRTRHDPRARRHRPRELDRIERSIDIDASAEKVWDLITRPGWWINEGEVDQVADVRREGDLDVVTHPKWGEFRIGTVESDRPRRLTYRWHDNASGGATTVAFRIAEREGGVTLSVVESGFLTLEKSREDVLNHVAENTDGWVKELEAARRYVTGAAV